MGAAILKTPELQLSEAEAKKLNDAVTDVMRFYTDVEMSPVVQAWLNLAMVGGIIYGPRFMAINIRRKSRPQTIPGPVPIPATPPRSQSQQPMPPVTPIRPQATAQSTGQASGPQPKPHRVEPPLLNLQEWSSWNAREATIGISE